MAQHYRHHQQPQRGERYLDESHSQLVARVFSYSLVSYVSDTVKNYYNYAKQSNYLVKAGLETAETYSQPVLQKIGEYSHQPPIGSILNRMDNFGCKQLDKIESGGNYVLETYEVIKPKTLQSLEAVANKIHGTTVETVLLKTVDCVDVVVDSLLPPPTSEPAEISQVASEDPNLVDRTAPVIKKLKNRVSKDSIKRLPTQTYQVSKDIIFRNADSVPQLHYCIGVLTTAAHRIHDVSSNTRNAAKKKMQKGANISKASVDYVYTSLNHMVGALASLVVLVKKLDPVEARATVEELTAMIQKSKDNITKKYGKDTAHRLKEDISNILQKAGDLLSQQVAAVQSRAQSSDHAAIRKSVQTIEAIVMRIIDRLPNHRQQNGQDEHEHEGEDGQEFEDQEQS